MCSRVALFVSQLVNSKASQSELALPSAEAPRPNPAAASPTFRLVVTLDYVGGCIQLDWSRIESAAHQATLRIRCTGLEELTWEWVAGKESQRDLSSLHRSGIRARLVRLSKRFPVAEAAFSARARRYADRNKPVIEPLELPPAIPKWRWLENEVVYMARDVRIQFSPLGVAMREVEERDPLMLVALADAARREEKQRRKQEETLARQREAQERMRRERLRRTSAKAARAAAQNMRAKRDNGRSAAAVVPARPVRPLPTVPSAFAQNTEQSPASG